MATSAWHALSISDVLKELETTARGLTEAQAHRRREVEGANVLPSGRRTTALDILLRQFRSAFIVILLAAAGISFALGDVVDSEVILAAVALNVVVGFIQEFRAERSLQRLKAAVQFETIARRDGSERQVPTADLVPGDIVLLQRGARVPADIRLVRSGSLAVNEAALTGESREVEKTNRALPSAVILPEQRNMAFFGTTVVLGEGEGVVVATGARTKLGEIASSLAAVREEATPLQVRLGRLGRRLAVIILSISAAIFAVGLAVGVPLVQIFTTAVAVSVAALPEGLPVAVTVVLAIGMRRILQRKSIVRSLLAAETLGSTTVIGTDKTGTLTEGEMRVVKFITPEEEFEVKRPHAEEPVPGSPEHTLKMLTVGVLCSDAIIENPEDAFEHWRIVGSPTERALVHVAEQLGVHERQLRREQSRLDAVPFDPQWKYMVTLNRVGGDQRMVYVKGAPEIVLRYATHAEVGKYEVTLDDRVRSRIEADYRRLSREGLRLIAFAYKPVPKGVDRLPRSTPELLGGTIFIGFAALKDPLRADARETIALVRRAGITPIMLTGDHRLTAQTIAGELGLPSSEENIIEGSHFERLTADELVEVVPKISVYARVTPVDKLRIIDAWQKRGEVVAMTGDGVNDAPALKAANIGIALGSGTDVAKEAADIILLDNRFSTIAHAVEQGRIIYENIRKVILYLVSDSFTEVILISVSLLLGLPLPLIASQILWINLVTDGFPAVALTVEPGSPDVMRQQPIPKRTPIFDRPSLAIAAVTSVVTALGGLLLFFAYWQGDPDSLNLARTVTFAAVAIDSLFYVYSLRTLQHSIFHRTFWSNPWLFVASVTGFGIQFLAIYHPFFQQVFHTVALGFSDWLSVLLVPLVAILAIELTKAVFRRRSAV